MKSEANVEARIISDGNVLALSGGKSRFIMKTDFSSWLQELESMPLDKVTPKPRLIHFLYEAGALLLGNQTREMPFYVVDTEFEKLEFANDFDNRVKLANRTGISFEQYSQSFERVQAHLHAGNAYQVNLTAPFDYDVDHDSSYEDTFGFLKSPHVGKFAQSVYFPNNLLSFVSNSPETLFAAKPTRDGQWRVSSLPIKGTAKSGEWEKLSSSMKDQAELLMITDLVRNDLNRLSHGKAQVDALKARMDVKGLVHQFSEVSALVSPKTSVAELMRCLFPGGSITGAPKKRVSEIINEVEPNPRGFYCGSTLFWSGSGLSASINIRSGTIDWKARKARLHAGGGITVQSNATDEWNELLSKLESLESVLT